MKRGKAANRLIDFYLGIPILNVLATLHRKGQRPLAPNRIGMLFNPALGDTLLASAATQDIRNIYPDARLIVFATSANIAAAKLLPGVDSIELLPLTRPVEAIRTLRKSQLDMMLDFTAWQRITAIYTIASGAQFTVGFKRGGQYRHRGYDLAIAHRGDCHEIANLRRLTFALGARSHAAPGLVLPNSLLSQLNLQSAATIIFHPWASGARSWMREWPEERWAELAQQLIELRPLKGYRILITGSPADESRCKALCNRIETRGGHAEPFIGRSGIGEVAQLLMQANLLVSVNTGIMHLGAIAGAPTISINGPTSSVRWGPVGPKVANVVPHDGSGGYLDLGFEYRGHTENVMEKISVADVVSAVVRLLNRQEQGHHA
jgi:ADP-heptose:LPS heptosyltransferase